MYFFYREINPWIYLPAESVNAKTVLPLEIQVENSSGKKGKKRVQVNRLPVPVEAIEMVAPRVNSGVLSGMRRSRTTPHQATAFVSKGPLDSRPGTRDTRPTFESPFVYEGRCNHGSMEELSSQALAQSEMQPFRKSSSQSVCLEKGVDRALVGGGLPQQDLFFDSNGHIRDTLSTSNSRREEIPRVEPRMIHTPSLSLQCRTESGIEAHEVETLHLDNV